MVVRTRAIYFLAEIQHVQMCSVPMQQAAREVGCSAFAHVGGSAAKWEIVARRREEIDHLGVFVEPCLVLRTPRNDHDVATAADPLFATKAKLHLRVSTHEPIERAGEH